jgi:FkbM family methyltransferase
MNPLTDVNTMAQLKASRATLQAARPWFDLLRSRMGYRFPRLGPVFFKCFYAAIRKRCTVELFPYIFTEANFDDLTHRATYWQGTRFEYPTAQVLCAWAAHPQYKSFFDIGANYGFFSYLMTSRFPQQAHAFDPSPVNYQQLVRAKSQNGLAGFHPHHLGLSDKEEILPLHLGIQDQGHSTFVSHPGMTNAAVSNCRVVRFDNWISEQHDLSPLPVSPHWIAKIDVEGYELKVLRGMEESLRRRRFIGLVLELNPYTLSLAGTGQNEISAFLASCGYRDYKETHAGQRFPLHRAPNGFFVPED